VVAYWIDYTECITTTLVHVVFFCNEFLANVFSFTFWFEEQILFLNCYQCTAIVIGDLHLIIEPAPNHMYYVRQTVVNQKNGLLSVFRSSLAKPMSYALWCNLGHVLQSVTKPNRSSGGTARRMHSFFAGVFFSPWYGRTGANIWREVRWKRLTGCMETVPSGWVTNDMFYIKNGYWSNTSYLCRGIIIGCWNYFSTKPFVNSNRAQYYSNVFEL